MVSKPSPKTAAYVKFPKSTPNRSPSLSPTSKPSPNPNPHKNSSAITKSYEPFQHEDIHVVDKVKYSCHIADWMDESYNKMVSIFIHLPSGINSDDICIKVHSGGMKMSLYQKVPSIFETPAFIMERYNCDANDSRVISVGSAINKQRKPINQGLCDSIYNEMLINLPFSCFERPVAVKRDEQIRDVDMFRFKHDNPELRKKGSKYLGCFIDLCALDKNQTRAHGHAVGRSK